MEREPLERFAQPHLIPYIDIGIDVHEIGADRFLIAGEVVLGHSTEPAHGHAARTDVSASPLFDIRKHLAIMRAPAAVVTRPPP